jgi:hypothetical protein
MLSVVVTGTEALFTIEEAKAHLVVETSDDDALIETYSNAAVASVLQYCNLSLVPDGPIPEAAFKAAALLVLGDLYANRETSCAGTVTVSQTARCLIDPYRWLRV